MNKHDAYLCNIKSISYNKDESLVPQCIVEKEEILKNLKVAYKEILMSF